MTPALGLAFLTSAMRLRGLAGGPPFFGWGLLVTAWKKLRGGGGWAGRCLGVSRARSALGWAISSRLVWTIWSRMLLREKNACGTTRRRPPRPIPASVRGAG